MDGVEGYNLIEISLMNHMADFTGTWNYQGKLAYSFLSGKTDPKGMDSHFNRISESKYNTFTYANHIMQLMHNKLEGWW